MRLSAALLISLVFLQSPAYAEGHSIGGKAGLLGLGIEYSYSISERIAFRGALYGSGYSFDATEGGIDYDFNLNWDSIAVGVDLHPLTGPFRLSIGLLANDNGLGATSTPNQPVLVGNTLYTPAEIGTLSGNVGFDGTTPFIGLGWDWSKSKRFGFSLDLGLVAQGSPDVSLVASGLLVNDPNFAADLAAEEAELEDALDDLDVLPFASFGVTFRF